MGIGLLIGLAAWVAPLFGWHPLWEAFQVPLTKYPVTTSGLLLIAVLFGFGSTWKAFRDAVGKPPARSLIYAGGAVLTAAALFLWALTGK